jgi:3-oxoacyl-[acyl-carrier-protein] synthase II
MCTVRRVVITGIGVLSSIGIGRAAFQQSLKEGRSGIGPITLFKTTGYHYKLGGEVKNFHPEDYFDKKVLRRMDRASQMTLVAAEQAVADAGLDLSIEDPVRCGALLGTTLGGMISGEKYHRLVRKNSYHPSLLLDFPVHAAVDRLAIAYNLQGPSSVFSTACASGAHSIGYGFDLISRGKADVILAGGVDTMAEFTQCGFGSLQALIKEGERVRPFDKNRCGFALGEGAAILILEAREHAEKRTPSIYSEIGGYGTSSDAYHMTAPDKEGKGAAKAMLRALAHAGIPPERVDYINAHGTATRHNDLMETIAIKKVFGSHAYNLAVSSTKSMIGHTLGAAGSMELAATALAMKDGFLPPTINYETPDTQCDLDYVPNAARASSVKIALSNSFGFGGANISILISKV